MSFRRPELGELFSCLLLIASCASLGAMAAQPGVPFSGKALLDELHKDGYIVYFRHTKTPPELIAAIRIEDWPKLARGESCCAPRAYWQGEGDLPVD